MERVAQIFSGIDGMDGTSWYHPRRLSIDSSAISAGNANPAQGVFGIRTTHGDDAQLPMYAFETSLGDGRVIKGIRLLARQSGVPRRDLEFVDRSSTYAHVDPLAASPSKNDFLKTVVPFLERVSAD